MTTIPKDIACKRLDDLLKTVTSSASANIAVAVGYFVFVVIGNEHSLRLPNIDKPIGQSLFPLIAVYITFAYFRGTNALVSIQQLVDHCAIEDRDAIATLLAYHGWSLNPFTVSDCNRGRRFLGLPVLIAFGTFDTYVAMHATCLGNHGSPALACGIGCVVILVIFTYLGLRSLIAVEQTSKVLNLAFFNPGSSVVKSAAFWKWTAQEGGRRRLRYARTTLTVCMMAYGLMYYFFFWPILSKFW